MPKHIATVTILALTTGTALAGAQDGGIANNVQVDQTVTTGNISGGTGVISSGPR